MKKGLSKVVVSLLIVSTLATLSTGLIMTVSASEVSVVEPIEAVVDLTPATLNLKSRGKWITGYIELPEGYEVEDIDVSSILLNGTIPVDTSAPTVVGDYDLDLIPDLMVKFSRADVSSFILSKGIMCGNVVFEMTGQLIDGSPFQGYITIKARMPGDVNADGKVNIFDILMAFVAFGSYPGHPKWNYVPDESEDNKIDLKDIITIAKNFGKTYP